jgi:TolB-like protein
MPARFIRQRRRGRPTGALKGEAGVPDYDLLMGAGPPMNRRLAAILAADIAGYSRLMHEDETSTVRDLKAHQSVVLPLIARHGGRIITEDLTSDLSRLAGSFVISRNTAFTFKGKAVDARQVGRDLGVRYVLEGSVRRMGRSVRINAQLVDAGTGAHLWAEQIDVDQGTLSSSQDNFGIANRLARALSVELVNVEGRRAPRANPDAVDLVMRGWSLLNAGPNREDVQNAVALFDAALRIDPDNIQANVGLAQALIHI